MPMPPMPRILSTRYLPASTSPTAAMPSFMALGSPRSSVPMISPRCRFVVLEEQPPQVVAGVYTVEHGVDDPRGAVDDVERRVEAKNTSLRLRVHLGILIGDPAGIDAVHVDSVTDVIRPRGPRHHVEGGLGHVGVRVLVGLPPTVKLPLHRRDVDH